MATTGTGFDVPIELNLERRQYAAANKEKEHEQQITDLLNQRDSLQQKFSTTLDANGQWTDATAQVNQDVLKNQAAIREFYHPDKNPGAIAKFGRLLMDRLHMTKPQQATSPSVTSQPTISSDSAGPSVPTTLAAEPAYPEVTDAGPGATGPRIKVTPQPGVPATSIPLPDAHGLANATTTDTMAVAKPKGLIAPGNLPIWNRPTVQNADGSHSSEYSVSFADKDGNEVLVPTVVDGKFLTPDGKKPPEGSKEEKIMFARAWQNYLKTGQNLGKFDNPADANVYAEALHNRGQRPGTVAAGPQTTVTGPEMTQAQRDQFNKQHAADQSHAAAVESAAPLSPEQVAAEQRRIQGEDVNAQMQQKMDMFDKLFPHATEEQKAQYKNMLAESMLGIKPSEELGKWVQVPGTVNGQRVTLLYDEKRGVYKTQTGEDLPAEVLRNFIPDPKQTKMSANDRLWDSYASSLGKTMDQLTMQDKAGFEGWLNHLKVRYNNRQVQVADRYGNIHIIDLTSTSGPVEITPSPVPGGAPTGGAPPANGAGPSGAPPAGARPASTPPARKPASPAASNGGRVLDFKKGTPTWNKASGELQEDQKVASLANSWVQIPPGQRAAADTTFILSLIKSHAGRVNQQEIQQYFNLGGISELPERWAAKVGHGELPETIRQQLYKMVQDQVEADKAALLDIDNPGGDQGGSNDFWSSQPLRNSAGAK
jgi:hypothetical protein